MSLGLCCHYLLPTKNSSGYENTGYINAMKMKSLQLGRFQRGYYSQQNIIDVYEHNLKTLIKFLPIICEQYKCFRITSGLFPLFEFVDEKILKSSKNLSLLKIAGQIIKDNQLRVTFHPGQFCSLSSDNVDVIKNSIKEINHHAMIFDEMGLDISTFYAINVHGGKSDRTSTLVSTINSKEFSNGARGRLTLENDENCYNVIDLLQVYKLTDVPIVFDSHHHTFNSGGINGKIASDACKETWKLIKPLQHISNVREHITESASSTERRQHGNYIHQVPDYQLNDILNDTIDCDVEAKLKNIAIDAMRLKFRIKN